MAKYLNGFFDDYRFLSNFWPSEFEIDGEVWPTVEHYFQAMKTEVPKEVALIFNSDSPAEAKRLGRKVQLRGDWESIKDAVMYEALVEKFSQNKHLADRLLETGDMILIEGNDWKDQVWGVPYSGIGENRLGELLMQVRSRLRDGKELKTLPIEIYIANPRPNCS